jgi:hypothetical protein
MVSKTYSTLTHYGGNELSLRSGHFISEEKNFDTNVVRGWVDTGLYMKPSRKITAPYQESKPTSPAHRQSLYRLSYTSLLEEHSWLINKTDTFKFKS